MRGFFGIGIYHPKTVHNIGVLWRSAHNFGASFIFTIGHRYKPQASDTTKAWKSVPLFEFQAFEEMREKLPREALLIGVEQCTGSQLLTSFSHPEQAVYLLGAEDYGLPEAIISRCHRIVEIPTPMCINVGVAGSIVMYDRVSKQYSNTQKGQTKQIYSTGE